MDEQMDCWFSCVANKVELLFRMAQLPRRLYNVLFLLLVSCSDNTGTNGTDSCLVVDLPLSGEQNAPVITDVALEVQADGIVVLATATDRQGSDNIRDVLQTIRLFQDARCERSPIVLQDDLAYSGVEESFGTAAPPESELFAAIAAADQWPVQVDFTDLDDNSTSGRVLARVIQLSD
jgi:hypothetical protein